MTLSANMQYPLRAQTSTATIGPSISALLTVLGEICDRPKLARLSALMTGIMTLVSCLTLMGVALALRRQLAMAFSNDPQVIAVAAAAMPILAGSLLGDGVNCAASGAWLCSARYRCHRPRGGFGSPCTAHASAPGRACCTKSW